MFLYPANRQLALGQVFRSKFLHGVIALTSGNMLGALIQILAAPVLGRIYDPRQYGELGGYMAIATLFTTLGNWQLSQGIIVERTENKAASLVYLCYWVTAAMAGVAAVASLFMVSAANWIGLSDSRWWYLTLPVSTFISGYCNCQSAVANRLGVYKRMALILVIPVAVTIGTSIVLGWLEYGVTGLFIAYFTGQILTYFMNRFWVPKLKSTLHSHSWIRMRAMLRKYKRFAIFTTPTNYISNLSMNAPIFALTAIGAPTTIGMFTRANQLLNMPVLLIGNSVAQVFQKHASRQVERAGTCWPLVKKTAIVLALAGAIPTFILAAFAPQLFAIVLGPNWYEAGFVAQILAPMLLLRVICNPLSTVYYVLGKQREDFILTTLFCTLTIFAVFITTTFSNNDFTIIRAYATTGALGYATFIVRSILHSRKASASSSQQT